jgi:DNA-binding transcriptional ArsR family regulator
VSLEDEIQDRLVADTESILQDNLDRVENLFQFHSDGTINIDEKYREVDPEHRVLIYLIAQRFAYEGGLQEEDTLETGFFYARIGRNESTIRNYLKSLREDGLVSKEGQSDYRVVVENLPEAIDRFQSSDPAGGGE